MKICPSSFSARPHGPAGVVVRPAEPLSVPAVAADRLTHPRARRDGRKRLGIVTELLGDRGELARREDEETTDEDRLCDPTFAVRGRLE